MTPIIETTIRTTGMIPTIVTIGIVIMAATGNDVYRIAQDQGYRDGLDHGAEHAREGKRYDPESTRHYKDATSGYRSEYGNKDAYKQAYREGFRQGYDEGYRRYGGRYGRRNSRPIDILGNILRLPY